MYKPSRLSAGLLVSLQLASLDLYATGGQATAQTAQQQHRAQERKVAVSKQHAAHAPPVMDDEAIDTLESSTYTPRRRTKMAMDPPEQTP